jgi:hypothetical protein
MKNILLLTAVLFAAGAKSQKIKESDVPKPVISTFQNKFKGAKVEKWEKEKDGNYEAEFDWNKVETSANFNAEGKLLETEQEISVTSLPKTVSDYVTKNYAGHKISEAAKITDSNGKTMYEAEVKKGKEEFDLIFDADGNFIKKIVEAEEDNDDEK